MRAWIRSLTVICFLVWLQILPCHAATFNWVGTGSNDWFNTNNWSPAGLPSAGDTVNFATGTINFTAPVRFSGQFNWSGGTMTGRPLTIESDGVLNISGNNLKNLWTGLTNAGSVVWTNAGDVNVDYSSAHNRFGFIENLAGATWEIQNNQALNNTFNNGAYFRNAGTIRKTGGAGNTSMSVPFLNTGTLSASVGTITFARGAVIEGTFNAAAGATMAFNAGNFTYTTPPTMAGAGAFRLNGGTLRLTTDTIANLQLLNGTVSLDPNFQGGTITNLTLFGGTLLGDHVVSGTFSWSGALPGSLSVLGGATVNWSGGSILGALTVASNGVLNISGNGTKIVRAPFMNAGTVTWSGGGGLQIDYSSADGYTGFIENLESGVWEIQGTGGINNTFNNGAYFRNAGVVRKSGGTFPTTFAIPFYNSGTVIALTSTIALDRDSIIDGTFEAAAGALISFNTGTFSYNMPPLVTGAGAVRLNGGTLLLSTDAIANLQIGGGIVRLAPEFQGGSITNLTMSGGVLEGDNVVSGTFNWSGGISGNLTVLDGATLNWSGGANLYPITILSNGVLNITGTSAKFIRNPLTNAGTVTWSGTPNLQVDYSSSDGFYGLIENLPGAVWDIQNNQNLFNNYNNGAYFRNAGTVRKSAGTGTSLISIPFFNTGTVTAQTGTLAFNRGALVEGQFDAAAAATINWNSGAFTYSTPPVVSGAGAVQFTGGTLTLADDIIPDLRLAGGTVSLRNGFQGGTITNLTLLAGTLTGNNVVSGVFNWAGTLPGSLMLRSGAVVNWTDGRAHGPITIGPDAMLNIGGDNTKFLWNALTNAGTVTWSGAADLRVDNSSSATNFGAIHNLAGALWDIRNNQNILNFYPAGAFFRNAGTVQKSGGFGVSTITIPFFNSGTVTAQVGTVVFNRGGLIEGTFGAGVAGTINFNTGTFNYGTRPTVLGAGVVQFTGGNLTLGSDIIPNLRLVGGTLSLGPGFQGGTITNLTLLGGTLTGDNSVSGTLNWAGTLSGSLVVESGATVNWSGGTAQGPVTVANGGTLNISGSGSKFLLNPLTNAGLVTWSSNGTFEVVYWTSIDNYGLVENLASGVFDIAGDSTMRNPHNFGAYFHNAGTVRKTAGSGTTTISIPFINEGTTMALQRTIEFSGELTLAGGTLVAGLSATPVSNAYGRFNIPGNAALDGALNVMWHGGFAGSISNTFTVMSYGSRTGTFDPVTLPDGAQWQVDYGARALTVFVAGMRRLGITSSTPGTTMAGATLAPVTVQVFDAANGAPIATNGLPVTIALGSGSGTLSGTLTRTTDANGRATFDDLTIDLVGAKTLSVSAPGTTSATSGSFNIVPAAPAQLGLVASIGPTQRNGAPFSPAAVVQVRDQFGNTVSNSTATITAQLASGGGGVLGGTMILNASGASSVAVFSNLVYTLADPNEAESIVVYFTSPGLSSVTNPPVSVQFVLGVVTLTSGNSVVRVNTAGDEGIFSWKVDGVEQLHQQWFWLRRGASGPQFPLSAMGPPIGVFASTNAVAVNYQTNGLNVNLALSLAGGAPGSFASDLTQTLTIENTSNGVVTLHVFQYADFDLAQQSGGDSVAFPLTNMVVQHGKEMTMTETAAPGPNYREASHYAITLDKIVHTAAATLSNQLIPPTPGDQTFAFQWEATLGPGQTLAIDLANRIRRTAAGAPLAEGLPILVGPLTLSIERSDEGVVISWPAATVGYFLEHAPELDVSAAWSAVTNSVNVSGDFYNVTLPPTDAAQFYRLKQ